MSSPIHPDAARDEIRSALDDVDAAQARLRAVGSDMVGNAFRVEVAAGTIRRSIRCIGAG